MVRTTKFAEVVTRLKAVLNQETTRPVNSNYFIFNVRIQYEIPTSLMLIDSNVAGADDDVKRE